ncbi:CpsB/CapC family capsule biosynthesis tyrosine phosphatase [Syntrophotalea acetylenica]|uniref:tyrosine-protein phosphatase n=1 Tax=Syntrophotalea TaxID=2812025 RepID=UPI002A35CA49|nr:CpsB/CapC family capsule biosynthesis tyrosine phosphatase [Syntrophotalea acetylenica]MDY0262752.1 CpsB/CapC family capsule biosynthesis tyrosine phosphatase [Syntrophotalea acetylenica]
MIDLHCHILPSMDDGASSMEESLAMARIAVADGTRTIVATPHVKNDIPSPQLIERKIALLTECLQQHNVTLDILPGGDVSSVLPVDIVSLYTLNRSRYVLLEYPHSHLPANAEQTIFEWRLAGLWPIITHPERNPGILKNPEALTRLVEVGALVQVTAGSLAGGFGADAQACACHLVSSGLVHILASDGHSSGHRLPRLSEGLRIATQLIGKAAALRLVEDNPAAIISGMVVDV